ncbi:hypothetical protein G8759_31380 [Spirosoma aureum]|uniref:Uncharacterized protein n=1 Tax=Spirosoma aureum TaxID=2692134 RepID=A0A6G9AWI3_9BACT|nr:hypothetical protein [Spirosoma aureum]QIP16827.1 hypothetical protein G8759_31380 [Spirosoma aureum]
MATRNLKFLALDIDTKEIVELTRQQVIDYLDIPDTPGNGGPIVVDPPPVVIDPPPVVVPRIIYGSPRTKVGDWTDPKGNTYPIFLGAGIKTALIAQKGSDPDEIFAVGFNLNYKLLPGITRPTGPESYYGVKPPAGWEPPLADYDELKFEDGATYYRLKAGSATVKSLETVFGDTYVLNKQ